MPALVLLNRQRGHRPDMVWLRGCFEVAYPFCASFPGEEPSVLSSLEEIVGVLVSDRRIANIHREFMNIDGATDVITFHHGEMVISADTAAEQARVRGIPIEHELGLYLIHGLLHLNGHEDATHSGFERMRLTQERILARVLLSMNSTDVTISYKQEP